jgi:nitrate/nitrite-specific signal transduction histidine kinase
MSKSTKGHQMLAELEKRVAELEADLEYAITNLEILLAANQDLIHKHEKRDRANA